MIEDEKEKFKKLIEETIESLEIVVEMMRKYPEQFWGMDTHRKVIEIYLGMAKDMEAFMARRIEEAKE